MYAMMRHRLGLSTVAVLTIALIAVPLLAFAGNDAQQIAQANAKIERVVDQATAKIERANSYDQMLHEAQKAETRVFRTIDQLERKIGEVEFKPFYVTVYNDDLDRSVTFDPVRITGSGT